MLKFTLILSHLDLTLSTLSFLRLQSSLSVRVVVWLCMFLGLFICLHTQTHAHPSLPYVYLQSYHTLVHLYTYLRTLLSNLMSTYAHLHVHLCLRTFLDRTIYDQPGVPSSDVIHILRNTR